MGASRDRGRCPVQQELRDRRTHISGLQATASSSSPNPSIQPLAGHLHGETGLTRTHRTPQVIASPLWPLAERFQPPGPGHPFIHGSLQGASCLIPPPTSLAGPLELLTSPSPIHGAPSSPPLLSGTHYAQSRDHPRSLVGSHPTPPITFMAPYSLWMNPGSSLLPVPSPRTPPLASQLLLPRAPLSAHSITLPCAGNHGYLGTLRKEQAMLHKLGTGFIAEPQRPCTLCNYSWEVGKGST